MTPYQFSAFEAGTYKAWRLFEININNKREKRLLSIDREEVTVSRGGPFAQCGSCRSFGVIHIYLDNILSVSRDSTQFTIEFKNDDVDSDDFDKEFPLSDERRKVCLRCPVEKLFLTFETLTSEDCNEIMKRLDHLCHLYML